MRVSRWARGLFAQWIEIALPVLSLAVFILVFYFAFVVERTVGDRISRHFILIDPHESVEISLPYDKSIVVSDRPLDTSGYKPAWVCKGKNLGFRQFVCDFDPIALRVRINHYCLPNRGIPWGLINRDEFNSAGEFPTILELKRNVDPVSNFSTRDIAAPIIWIQIGPIGECKRLTCNLYGLFGCFRTLLGRLCSLSDFSQGFLGNASLFSEFKFVFSDLVLQQYDLIFSGQGGPAIRSPRQNRSSSGNAGEENSAYTNAIFEMRLRFLIGFPLLFFGIWLLCYCDRTLDRDVRWWGWLLWLIAFGSLPVSFILILFRGSLLSVF